MAINDVAGGKGVFVYEIFFREFLRYNFVSGLRALKP